MASVRKRTWKSGDQSKSAWVADYVDQHGKRHLKTFERKKDADTWLVDARGEVKRGVHTPDSSTITIAEAAELWLERGRREKLERGTLRNYGNHVKHHIEPMIGAVRLARLSRPAVEEFRDKLLDRISRTMARKVLTSLKGIISEAHRRGLVAQNVASTVKIDRKQREDDRLAEGHGMPSKQEVQALLSKAEGPWRPFFITAVFTGMRCSELRGLQWDAVDFKRQVIHVRQRADPWRTLGPPKSKASNREIPMSPMVVNALREWRLACPRCEGRLWLVFPNGAGNVEWHVNIAYRAWYPLQVAAGVVKPDGKPKYGIHALRHFFASWAIERGFTPKRVQTLLGHSSIQMTFDVYGHLFPNLEDDHAKFAAGELEVIGSRAESA